MPEIPAGYLKLKKQKDWLIRYIYIFGLYTLLTLIGHFEAFYQNVSEQQGISFERKGNTIILPKEFLCGSQELRAVLTFEKGTVKVGLVY